MVDILFIYWAESGIIGVFNVFKMLLAKNFFPLKEELDLTGKLGVFGAMMDIIWKIMLIPFFIVHFGGFMAVHGFFLYRLAPYLGAQEPIDPMVIFRQISFAFLSLAISHGYSFFTNYVFGEEKNKSSLIILFYEPYPRIIVMHMVIILGAFLTAFFHQSIYMLLLLVILKTFADYGAHIKERFKFGSTGSSQSPFPFIRFLM
jgi:hypothetical protein